MASPMGMLCLMQGRVIGNIPIRGRLSLGSLNGVNNDAFSRFDAQPFDNRNLLSFFEVLVMLKKCAIMLAHDCRQITIAPNS